MSVGYIAWVTVTTDESQSPHSVLMREDGATEPPDYRVPPRARVRVQMLQPGEKRYVEICDDRLRVRDLSSYGAISEIGLPIAPVKPGGRGRI
jgi:hypothetical protein